ncbi:Transcriptional Coactivator p15 (PC4) [Roseivivax lentus]|uniref:Transcriptional Coactivator p15 (PC4) n=1 Tax=Roseivivax lentus TaxID=633194 RepID=A0A1N7Q6B3_9RHOB|nr:PC4/YdbC family ssDNA-binding protein [Roseivivax lentus]SIT18394.1 Transcriptional Coactivator p15 (PC4) [Roseivivax lentus]
MVIAEMKKNSRGKLVVIRELFKGHDVVGVRAFIDPGNDEMLPCEEGIAIRAILFPELTDVLDEALWLGGSDAD